MYKGSMFFAIFGRKFERPSIPWFVSKNIEVSTFCRKLANEKGRVFIEMVCKYLFTK